MFKASLNPNELRILHTKKPLCHLHSKNKAGLSGRQTNLFDDLDDQMTSSCISGF